MFGTRFRITCGIAIAALFLAACGSTPASPAKTLKIAFLMPCSTCADRFEHQDKPDFIAAVHAIDPSIQVIANNAEGSDPSQISQAEAALTSGANVIVISPLDEATGQAIVSKTAAVHVPVISYDGLLTGAKVDFYASFDNVKTGVAQGQYLVDSLPAGASVAMINGAQDIAPGRQFKQGTEQALTKLNNHVDAVLVANDGMAGGVVAALTAQHLAGKVVVTGQDATDAGLQRIVLGTQSMTVYKSIKLEAQAAAQVAVALAKGDQSKIKSVSNTTTDNGAGSVPSDILQPTVITKSNAATVVTDGFTTWQNICAGAPSGSTCPPS